MNKYPIESTETKGKNLDSRTKVDGVTVDETKFLFAIMDDIKATEIESATDDTFSSVEEIVTEETAAVKTDVLSELRDLDLQTFLGKLPKRYLLERLLNYSSQFRRQIIYYTLQALRT